MPASSEELSRARREEIINACAELYRTMSFKEVTIKEIGRRTSFTRTSIYNYFRFSSPCSGASTSSGRRTSRP